ncbi:hypothetical protein [Streptosporangium sp. NPDC000396]|uniref:hypothetical protein n=1 Tax=Streptosporangium sp. NPDC000396 TaxID=3366185 RepID=UPI0036858E35
MSALGCLKLSVAVMYHPSRASRARELAEQCAELRPELVADPDPAGFPSPLRTAKLAWAACASGATHHLVLQDDVVLAKGFAAHLEAIVRCRPDHGIALYVNRNSQRNAYLFRRAAALGVRWSQVSRFEYTPTLGFLLPADQAKELARYLSAVPDEFRDDDEAVTLFCRNQGIPVVSAVPNLLDHGDLPSVAGNHEHGARHAAAFADRVGVDIAYWEEDPAEESREGAREGPPFALEIYDSRCLIRFTRPGSSEPVDNLFGWYWHDWCELLGVVADHVLETWREHMVNISSDIGFPFEAALELWAAGYVLGFDTSSSRAAAVSPAFRASVESWVVCGLAPDDDARLDASSREKLIETCLAGFQIGRTASASVRSAA